MNSSPTATCRAPARVGCLEQKIWPSTRITNVRLLFTDIIDHIQLTSERTKRSVPCATSKRQVCDLYVPPPSLLYTQTRLCYVTPRWWRVGRTFGLGLWAKVPHVRRVFLHCFERNRTKTCSLVRTLRLGLYQKSRESFEGQYSCARFVRERGYVP